MFIFVDEWAVVFLQVVKYGFMFQAVEACVGDEPFEVEVECGVEA